MAILHFKNSVFIPMLTEFLNILKSNLLHILKLPKGILFLCGDLEVPLELISLQLLNNHTFINSQIYKLYNII